MREIKRIAAFILWHLNANHTLQVQSAKAPPFSFFQFVHKNFFPCRRDTHTAKLSRQRERECKAARALAESFAVCVLCICVCVCVCCRYVCFAIVFRANAAQTAKRNLNLFFSPVALTITCKVTLTVLGSGCGCGRGRGSSQHIHSDS